MKDTTTNYQKLQNELSELLDRLRAGEVDVDQAVKDYERGREIIKQLQQYLKTAENKITQVKLT